MLLIPVAWRRTSGGPASGPLAMTYVSAKGVETVRLVKGMGHSVSASSYAATYWRSASDEVNLPRSRASEATAGRARSAEASNRISPLSARSGDANTAGRAPESSETRSVSRRPSVLMDEPAQDAPPLRRRDARRDGGHTTERRRQRF
jgi:hypothetical protein